MKNMNVLTTLFVGIDVSARSNVCLAMNFNSQVLLKGSGSGKIRFFVKLNLMQMYSSYCVTDPKGSAAH